MRNLRRKDYGGETASWAEPGAKIAHAVLPDAMTGGLQFRLVPDFQSHPTAGSAGKVQVQSPLSQAATPGHFHVPAASQGSARLCGARTTGPNAQQSESANFPLLAL